MLFMSPPWRLLLLLLAVIASTARASDPPVVLVRSPGNAPYLVEAAAAVRDEIERGNGPRYDVRVLTQEQFSASQGPPPRLYIALGTEACDALASAVSDVPLLCALLPRTSFERVLLESGRRAGAMLSAVYLNQPPGRQLDLARLALPRARRVGVLWGKESRSSEALLAEAARTRGVTVVGVPVGSGEPIYKGLRTVLDESDVLLALADPEIYNSHTLQNILLSSFRSRVPMLAFSPAYVRAGALMAVYSTPAQIARQAAGLARGVLQGQALGAPQYPTQFEVGVNEHVARSLGLSIDAAALEDRLRKLEREP